MGVPKFYRWLSERYPMINQIVTDSSLLPEVDNLYLDMNGIIHACTHPNENDVAHTLSLREMILGIFRYIDRCVSEIVKPRKVLFLAIDGVAPRAKLNQQRARRFRAAQERAESILKVRQRGDVVDESTLFDSNCITPGTEFMEVVNKHLRWFIRKKMKEDPIWRNLEVIFSGHDVPGEGEHKIMQYIRDARAKPGFLPNQRHCMYGQDADLIMLALATHEPHFTLLREVIDFGGGRKGPRGARNTVMKQTKEAQFQLLHISILREYLELELSYGITHRTLHRERLIDDFIFLTFLVGNDFLPHLPTLDIGEEAFNMLFQAYKSLYENPSFDYLIKNGELHDLPCLEKLFTIIGQKETEILQNRESEMKQFNARRRKYKEVSIPSEEEEEEIEEAFQRAYEEAQLQAMIEEASAAASGGVEEWKSSDESTEAIEHPPSKVEVASPFTAPLTPATDISKSTQSPSKSLPITIQKSKRSTAISELRRQQEAEDKVAAQVVKDYRGRYYYEKFKVLPGLPKTATFLVTLMTSYLEGLIWCLAYYTKGCVSWTWYFPYHYGPMLQDMTNLTELESKISFQLGQPFRPFQQLLGCISPLSKSLLPKIYQWIMTSDQSPIKEFYPEDFAIDMNGKRSPWEAVVLLPFIDEQKLMAAEAQYCPPSSLTSEEKLRNEFGKILIFQFDPTALYTVYSCNPTIGLSDISQCQTKIDEKIPDLYPGRSFAAEVIPGSKIPFPGFPSLAVLPVLGARWEEIKLNVFGSESKYATLILKLTDERTVKQAEDYPTEKLEVLLGRSVFINYPSTHEAKVVAVTTKSFELRLNTTNTTTSSAATGGGVAVRNITKIDYDDIDGSRWQTVSGIETTKYLKGRGVPGTGGLDIGEIPIRLRVVPLQGMSRDPTTGVRRKRFGKVEADIPLCMSLLAPPVLDPRFEETEALSLSELLPYDSMVLALEGEYKGCKGRVVGPHGPPTTSYLRDNSISKLHLKTKEIKDIKNRNVIVEFPSFPPEAPFGYIIAASIKDVYYSSKEVCDVLKMSPNVFGKIVGAVLIEPGRKDVGLNLKRNGQYQLLGYARRVENKNNKMGGTSNESNSLESVRNVWFERDTVQVIGSSTTGEGEEEGGGGGHGGTGDGGAIYYWEYTMKTVILVAEYRERYPILFSSLQTLPHQSKYTAAQLLGGTGCAKVLEDIELWMKAQPVNQLPRTPFSTSCLPKEAISAIERAADVLNSYRSAAALASGEGVATGSSPSSVPVVRTLYLPHQLYCPDMHTAVDTMETTLTPPTSKTTGKSQTKGEDETALLPPQLGDRVVNVRGTGVPLGLRGTVISIHELTAHVEVLFDEEFLGGKSLQGSCSQFRGKLLPWNTLLRTGNPTMKADIIQKYKVKSNASVACSQSQYSQPPASGPGRSDSTGGVNPEVERKKMQRLLRQNKNEAGTVEINQSSSSSSTDAPARVLSVSSAMSSLSTQHAAAAGHTAFPSNPPPTFLLKRALHLEAPAPAPPSTTTTTTTTLVSAAISNTYNRALAASDIHPNSSEQSKKILKRPNTESQSQSREKGTATATVTGPSGGTASTPPSLTSAKEGAVEVKSHKPHSSLLLKKNIGASPPPNPNATPFLPKTHTVNASTGTAPTGTKPTGTAPTGTAPTVNAPTVIASTGTAPTSIAPTSNKPTGTAPSGIAPTSIAPTSSAPTVNAPTVIASTGTAPTSNKPTGTAPTGIAPTVNAPTVIASTVTKSTGIAPSGIAPTVNAPTSIAPTSSAPTVNAPTVIASTVTKSTGIAPSGIAPTVNAPTSIAPTGTAPTVNAPTVIASTGTAPTGTAPSGIAPTSTAPTSSAPTSTAPTVTKPTGIAPTGTATTGTAPTSTVAVSSKKTKIDVETIFKISMASTAVPVKVPTVPAVAPTPAVVPAVAPVVPAVAPVVPAVAPVVPAVAPVVPVVQAVVPTPVKVPAVDLTVSSVDTSNKAGSSEIKIALPLQSQSQLPSDDELLEGNITITSPPTASSHLSNSHTILSNISKDSTVTPPSSSSAAATASYKSKSSALLLGAIKPRSQRGDSSAPAEPPPAAPPAPRPAVAVTVTEQGILQGRKLLSLLNSHSSDSTISSSASGNPSHHPPFSSTDAQVVAETATTATATATATVHCSQKALLLDPQHSTQLETPVASDFPKSDVTVAADGEVGSAPSTDISKLLSGKIRYSSQNTNQEPLPKSHCLESLEGVSISTVDNSSSSSAPRAMNSVKKLVPAAIMKKTAHK